MVVSSRSVLNQASETLLQSQPVQSEVLKAVQEIVKKSQPQVLPLYVDLIVRLFHSAHLYYRAYKYELFIRKSIKNSSTGHPAVYGAALHLFGEYTSIGKYAINIALVVKCTHDLMREYKELNLKYRQLTNCIKKKYPVYYESDLKKLTVHKQSFFPFAFQLAYQVRIQSQAKQIQRVWKCSKEFFWQTFRLSMTLCDCHLLLNGNSLARFEACTELVSEWSTYQNQLKDRQFLFNEIQLNKKIADRVLVALGTNRRISSVIEKLKNKGKLIKSGTKAIFNSFYEASIDTIGTFYVKGKITSLSIDFMHKKTPFFPPSRFPPWVGQKV